jgi:hypothetical protein
MFIDAINVKIRDGRVANRPIYVALAVTCDGERDILGLWAGEHGDGEGAKYWPPPFTGVEVSRRHAGVKGAYMRGEAPLTRHDAICDDRYRAEAGAPLPCNVLHGRLGWN